MRTEGHRVRETAFSDAADKSDEVLKNSSTGLRMTATWRTMRDGAVRNTDEANHVKMDGVTILQDEEFELTSGATCKCPGTSGVAAEDCNCRCYVSHRLMTDEEFYSATGRHFDDKAVDNSGNSGIINTESEEKAMKSGALYGALNPESDKDFARCEEHATKYYEEIRKRESDIKAISKNTGYSKQEIETVKAHLFINKYDLGEDEPTTFYPSYDIAVSWQNLIEGKHIEEKDIILLKHELYEYNLMQNEGLPYLEAHERTQKLYNYQKAVNDWRAKK